MKALCLAVYFALCPLPAIADSLVFAAASLKTALDEAAEAWGAMGHAAPRLSYAGSGVLARQIVAGAPAEIFISANPQWMDATEASGALAEGSRRDLLGNRLVLVAPADRAAPVPLSPDGLRVALGGGHIAMGFVDAVPAGQYGRAALIYLGLWDEVEAQVAQVDNVRAALLLVALGEAPLGVVYATDAAAEPGVSVVAAFPEDSHPPIIYPAALTGHAGAEAADFLDWLSGPEAAAIFEAHGFSTGPVP